MYHHVASWGRGVRSNIIISTHEKSTFLRFRILRFFQDKRRPWSASASWCHINFTKCRHRRWLSQENQVWKSCASKFMISFELRFDNILSEQKWIFTANLWNFQAAWALITEFCANSTVHGVRYFTEAKRHWSERCGIDTFHVCLIFDAHIHSVWIVNVLLARNHIFQIRN